MTIFLSTIAFPAPFPGAPAPTTYHSSVTKGFDLAVSSVFNEKKKALPRLKF